MSDLPASNAQTLQSYSEAWLNAATGSFKASTLRFYKRHLEKHILPALGSSPISGLRRADCRDLIVTCRGKALKVATVRGVARTSSTILTQAVEDELLPANPALRLG